MEIVKFYQEGRGEADIWDDKMGVIGNNVNYKTIIGDKPGFKNPVRWTYT
jgi:hypothetical protein